MKPINHVPIVLLFLLSKKLTQLDISTHADDGCLPPLVGHVSGNPTAGTARNGLARSSMVLSTCFFVVTWDNPTSSSVLPERVCPWRIDPTEVTKMKKPLTLHPQKRARPIDASSPEFSGLAMDGMLHGSAKHQSQNSSRALQVQEESNTCANQSGALRQSLLHFLLQHPGRTSMQQQMPKQQEIQIPICNPFYHYTRAANGHRYMLFGVNLANGSPELPSPQVLISSEAIRGRSTPSTSQSSVVKPSKCISSKKCNNCCSVGSRSCTKVLLLPFLKLLDGYSIYTRNVIKRGKDK
ncbi:hypothetical protein V6N12_034949 [Hibiscus sabdariffa]|uniref:Uncharacterized protein n=1 Tax=Hibiscus sabdariffa TaxID=183260 RepID=A0ABR2BNX2_9ROSI